MRGVLNVCDSHSNNTFHRSVSRTHKRSRISLLNLSNRPRTTITMRLQSFHLLRLIFSLCLRH
jgi:hypothetical protein